jgi:hypothetical protein
MQKRRENQIRGLTATTSALVVYRTSTKQRKHSLAVSGFPAIPSFLVGVGNLLLIQNLK